MKKMTQDNYNLPNWIKIREGVYKIDEVKTMENETKPQGNQMDTEVEYVNDIEFSITKIEIQENVNCKVSFHTNKGIITWKAKTEIKEKHRGIEVHRKIDATADTLPEELFKLQQEINDRGSVKVKGSYSIFRKRVDGEDKQYRFIQGINPLLKWVIVKDNLETENVRG